VFEADHNPLFQKSGMAADFGDLKAVVKKIVDDWDHSVVLNSHDPLLPLLRDATASGTLGAQKADKIFATEIDVDPTSEWFSYHLYQKLTAAGVGQYGVRVLTCTVWETPGHCATYVG